jgi:D-alanyl-D-alanine carboxypeptidase
MKTTQTAAARSGLAVGSVLMLLGLGTAFRSTAWGSAARDVAGILHAEVVAGRTPSVQYRFFSGDSILFAYDEGLADIGEGRRATGATTYNGFSITKTLTALAVLRLAERESLDLDSPAADFLPRFPYGPEITVRHLLTHSAGIADPIPLRWIHLEGEHEGFDRDEFFDAIFVRRTKLKRRPNERFAYSNLGYVLLGQIIEEVSGASYEEYMREHVLAPMGLAEAELGFTRDDAVHARGYHRRNTLGYFALGILIDRTKYMEADRGPWRPFRPYHVNGAAYGGVIGTADGFARYGQALLDPRSELISEEVRRTLFTENILNNGNGSGMSHSWFRGELDGHTYYAHAGGGGGYYAELRIYPELQRGSVILFNRTGLSDARFLDRVDRGVVP